MNPLDCNEPFNIYLSIMTPVIKQLIILKKAVLVKGLRWKRIERKYLPTSKNDKG